MILIFVGPPGSGKGTQTSFLSEKFHILSIGDILRSIIETDSKEAGTIKELIENGKLVPSNITNKVVLNAINSVDQSRSIILDGYPRNVEQAIFLRSNLLTDFRVIFFNIEDKFLFQRLGGRFNCHKCGKIYNKFYHLPKISGICDQCGSSDFKNRSDDREDVIKTRLEFYKKETLPLLDFYKEMGKLIIIDAAKPADVIAMNIRKILKSY